MPKLGGGQGPSGPLVNAVVGHLHDPHQQGMETLLHYHPRRRHRVDASDYYLVEGVEAVAIFHQQPGSNAGIVVGIPVKEDRLRRLPE